MSVNSAEPQPSFKLSTKLQEIFNAAITPENLGFELSAKEINEILQQTLAGIQLVLKTAAMNATMSNEPVAVNLEDTIVAQVEKHTFERRKAAIFQLLGDIYMQIEPTKPFFKKIDALIASQYPRAHTDNKPHSQQTILRNLTKQFQAILHATQSSILVPGQRFWIIRDTTRANSEPETAVYLGMQRNGRLTIKNKNGQSKAMYVGENTMYFKTRKEALAAINNNQAELL